MAFVSTMVVVLLVRPLLLIAAMVGLLPGRVPSLGLDRRRPRHLAEHGKASSLPLAA